MEESKSSRVGIEEVKQLEEIKEESSQAEGSSRIMMISEHDGRGQRRDKRVQQY